MNDLRLIVDIGPLPNQPGKLGARVQTVGDGDPISERFAAMVHQFMVDALPQLAEEFKVVEQVRSGAGGRVH